MVQFLIMIFICYLNQLLIIIRLKLLDFDTFDSSGKDINKFASELTLFLKDVILYSNAKLLSDIDIKNENIVLVNNLYDSKTIYELIEKLNEIQNF